MGNWDDYVKRFYTLSSEEQAAAWSNLTEEQRAEFHTARGRANSSAPVPQKKSTSKVLLALAGCGCAAVLAFVILLGWAALRPSGIDQSIAADDGQPAVPVNAERLVAAYDQNEVAADKKFKGRVLLIDGVIENVGRDILDEMYVALEGPSDTFRGVQCYFNNRHEEQLAALRTGQVVLLRGRCDGLMGNVVVRDCEVSN